MWAAEAVSGITECMSMLRGHKCPLSGYFPTSGATEFGLTVAIVQLRKESVAGLVLPLYLVERGDVLPMHLSKTSGRRVG